MIVILGWGGTLLYLLNHAYLSFIPNWNKTIYYSVNLIAALALVVSSVVLNSWQAVAINMFWAVVSALMVFEFSLRNLPILSRRFFLLLSVLVIVFVFAYLSSSEDIWNLVSWIAAVIFCISYLMFTISKMNSKSYQIANFFAAIMCLPALWLQKNFAVFALEIVWALISIWSALKNFEEAYIID